MPVPPNYFITGVWNDAKGRITHVFLHPNGESGFSVGVKTSEAEAIRLREANNSMMTLRWNYTNASWKRGAIVNVVQDGGVKYLRTVKDASVEDNLDNMIKMNGLIAGV